MKKITLVSLVLTLCAMTFAAPASIVTRTGVQFIEGASAVDEILSGPAAPCVPRLPAWELSVGEGAVSVSALQKLDADCRDDLTAAVRDFSDEEKNMLMKYVVLIDSIIDADFPVLNSFPWSFAVICDSSDFGIPVSSRHVVLTKGLLNDMTDWMENQTSMRFVGMEILVHEKVRLLQTAMPAPFERFYRGIWGFRRLARPLDAAELAREHDIHFTRFPLNEWVIRAAPRGGEFIMPALLLRDSSAVGATSAPQRVAILADSSSRGFTLREPPDYRDMRLFQRYRQRFPQSEHNYHPDALSADLLAKFLVAKYISAKYGTAPARAAHYSQIDVLIRYVGQAVEQ